MKPVDEGAVKYFTSENRQLAAISSMVLPVASNRFSAIANRR
ncbi:hypothetical protein [Mycobacterium sp. URHB0021]|jgi:hypothetical protein